MKQSTLWLICRILAIGVLVFILLIPPGKSKPYFLGTPYALWTGLMASVLLTILTWWGTQIQSTDKNDAES
ncbi:MAG: hypothetical protein R3C61_15450 [Bacteroidia bacterium]